MAASLRIGGPFLLTIITLALLAFGVYGVQQSAAARVPLPTVTQVLAIGLPLLNLALFWLPVSVGAKLSSTLTAGVAWLVSLLEVALIVQASLHTSNFNNFDSCTLQEIWLKWFMNKSETNIKAIQDRFGCCGLRSTRDKAWPFQDDRHGVTACVEMYGRSTSCLSSWLGEANKDLRIFLAIGIVLLGVKVLLLILAASSVNLSSSKMPFSTWLPNLGGRRSAARSEQPRRAVLPADASSATDDAAHGSALHDVEQPYRDDIDNDEGHGRGRAV